MSSIKLTQNRIVGITAVLIVLACFFAIYLRLFTEKELWYEMFAAVLGVIITAIITMILLRGQSENDVERERAAKVFEEKLRIYQEYLQTLYNVIKDGSLSDEEKMLLEFQTSYVAMHCAPNYIASVSSAVKRIIEHTCSEEEEKSVNTSGSDTPEPLLENLFCVVEAFRKDLYGVDFKFDEKYKNDTLTNFSNAYRNAKDGNNKPDEEPQHLKVDLNVLSGNIPLMQTPCENKDEVIPEETVGTDEEDCSLWETAVRKWDAEGWKVQGFTGNENWLKVYNTEGNPGLINMGFYEGHYYIEANYQGDTDFSKPLKWEYGGRRNRGNWWKHLPAPYYDIKEGEFLNAFKGNKELQQFVVDYVEELMGIITHHHRTALWKKQLGKVEGWTTFIWYWRTLACTYESEEDGRPYIDVLDREDTGKPVILLHNRQHDMEKLHTTLKRIGCEAHPAMEDGRIILEELDSDKPVYISERVRFWIQKVAH